MLIKQIHVRNYRSILDESLTRDSLTTLVGRNGSGKSSFLSALELFYNPSPRLTGEDFYAEDMTQDIEIAITFSCLSQEAKELFSSYLDNETLTVVRVLSGTQSRRPGTYHGMRMQNPDFEAIRNAGGARDVRNKYNEVRNTAEYSGLPTVRSEEQVRLALTDWETQNPGKCSPLRDDGQFFGFTEVGLGYLGRFTRFIYVPAVRDAAEDATEKRGSSVTEIMDLVVRSALSRRQELSDFQQQTQERYRQIMNPQNLTELKDLEHNLSDTLQSYVPDAGVLLQWSEFADISIPMPQAQVKLLEDEYESRVERTGHGLQRAFIVTMLQHLIAARGIQIPMSDESSTEDTESEPEEFQLPNLVLAIEEPELYQHPSRQRHLASVLLKLATGEIPGVAKNTQVIYATHSPLFVGLDRFDQIRVLRKVALTGGKPKATIVKSADMEKVANEIWTKRGAAAPTFTAETLRPRLHAIMTPWMNEAFFADVAVLVEGEDDRAAILGVAASMGQDFDSLGITVIPCFGKTNLDRPLVILRQLGIPVYVVWDGDHNESDANPETNRYMLRLLDQPEQDWPDLIGESCACFKVKLENTLAEEIGTEVFEELLSNARTDLSLPRRDQALKNPSVIEHIIQSATTKGKSSKSLERIVSCIAALRDQTGVVSP